MLKPLERNFCEPTVDELKNCVAVAEAQTAALATARQQELKAAAQQQLLALEAAIAEQVGL